MHYPRASTHIAQCPTCGLPMSLLAWSPIPIALAEPTDTPTNVALVTAEQDHRKKRIKAASIGGPIIIHTPSVIGAFVSRRRH
jgi:hypothetical protein